jgi:hypothetical protein
MRKELRERLAGEFRYALGKMQEEQNPTKKLFYFSIFFAEPQRLISLEWDSNVALVGMVIQQVHTQISVTMQNPVIAQSLPIDWQIAFDKLAEGANDLTTYFENTEDKGDHKGLCDILGQMNKISFVISGHGSYLLEKGTIKL